MREEKILVLDFGGQYNQLIARRVRECNVYCEVHPYNMPLEKIKEYDPMGIIFTGGPNSVFGEDAPLVNKELFNLGYDLKDYIYKDERIFPSRSYDEYKACFELFDYIMDGELFKFSCVSFSSNQELLSFINENCNFTPLFINY